MFDLITTYFENLLSPINVHPQHYGFLFKDEFVESTKLNEFVEAKLIPRITDFAPALTYCLLLGVARFILKFVFFKV